MSVHHHKKPAFKLQSRAILGEPQTPTFVKLLLGKKIVKNESQAAFALLSILFILLAASAFFVGRSVYVPTAKISPSFISINQQ